MQLHTLTAQPLSLIVLRILARVAGSLRQRERFHVLNRANYAYGLLRAADLARFSGKREVTVCEFGVATGGGLLNMASLSRLIGAETGVRFRVVGFDLGHGLPPPQGPKDHPEMWSAGDFAMVNREDLQRRLAGQAELVIGDIKDTVGPFVETLTTESPLGFISIDVDIYTAARDALTCLLAPADRCAPAIPVYLDDVGTIFSNRWCGELAAVDEFNQTHALRKVDRDRSLPGARPVQTADWYGRMYVCHVLDHPLRSSPVQRRGLSLEEHRRTIVAGG